MNLVFSERSVAFRAPLRTSYGELTRRTLFDVRLTGPEGLTGRGEAAPLEPYDGVSDAAVRDALEAYAGAVAALEADADALVVLEACRAAADLPQALSAVDLALWDRAGRRFRRPVAELLTDDPLHAVPVNATVDAADRAGAATACAEAAAAGFHCVKLKVGVGDDAGRVAAARAAAGPDMALRLDANGAWEVEEAVRTIEALAPAGLELVEEPVHGVDALREVRDRVPVRIAMDETGDEPGAIASGAADAVCLKLAGRGGISGLLATAALAQTTGSEVYLASTFDGPLGIAAAVHCAAALRVGTPCGLATLSLLELPVPEVLRVRNGAITLPAGPGLL
jgi:L-alanine-DL-glutamate epimerase-like enolase superfamily enzyme